MASFVSTNASVVINSVDLSDHVESVELSYQAEAVEDTAMGDTVRSNTGGLKVIGLSITFHQDDAASEVSATLFPLVGSTTTVVIKPVNAAVSTSNPSYSTTMLLTEYPPISGSVGELSKATVSFAPAGVALTRATA